MEKENNLLDQVTDKLGKSSEKMWDLPQELCDAVSGGKDFTQGNDFAQNYSCFAQNIGDFSQGVPPITSPTIGGT